LISKVLYLTIAACLVGIVLTRLTQNAMCGDFVSACKDGVIFYEHFAIGAVEIVLVAIAAVSALFLGFMYVLKVWLYLRITALVEKYLQLFKIDIR
jgi:hypothetical protein